VTSPDISIVVCTRNRALLLPGALTSLYDLATENEFTYEIVVVDHASSDSTPQVIAEAAKQAKHPLRGVREERPGIVAARNRGIDEAQGRWIAFFDDDQLADWHWLAELYRGAAEHDCRVVGGAVQLALPAGCTRELAPTVRMLLGESMGGDHPQRYGGRLTPGCGNLMVERSVFEQIGQFETAIDGRGEDADLFERLQRARIDAWYIPTATIHHLTPPERLQREYLLRISAGLGRGAAVRQLKALGLIHFTCLWLAKAARVVAIDYPQLMLAGIRRNDEATLGQRCQLTISQGFLSGACRPETATAAPSPEATYSVMPPASQAAETVAAVAAERDTSYESIAPAAPVPLPLSVPAPALAFTIRPGEPTAVMHVPGFSVGAPSPTVPIQR
jgi:GT2 family glycosyltransferase